MQHTIMQVKLWHIIAYIITIILCVYVLFSLNSAFLPAWLMMALDSISGILFGLSIILITGDSKRVMKWLNDHLEKGHLPHLFISNYRIRTMALTGVSILVGLFYILINLYYGLKDHSFWYCTISVYYLLLSFIRSYIVGVERAQHKSSALVEDCLKTEKKVFFLTGILLTLMSVVISGTVVLTFLGGADIKSSGIFIYAVAIYTFYKLTMSILNLKTAAKQESYMVKAVRNIGFCDALTSMIHLQIVLIARYGSLNDPKSEHLNELSGSIICLTCLGIGIYMILEYFGIPARIKKR